VLNNLSGKSDQVQSALVAALRVVARRLLVTGLFLFALIDVDASVAILFKPLITLTARALAMRDAAGVVWALLFARRRPFAAARFSVASASACGRPFVRSRLSARSILAPGAITLASRAVFFTPGAITLSAGTVALAAGTALGAIRTTGWGCLLASGRGAPSPDSFLRACVPALHRRQGRRARAPQTRYHHEGQER
jgi:hypothetical protein